MTNLFAPPNPFFLLDPDNMYRNNRRAVVGYKMGPGALARRIAPAVASAAYKAYQGYQSKPRPPSNSNVRGSQRRRKPFMLPKKKTSLTKQVKAIQKELKTNQGTLVYKEIATGRAVQPSVNQQTLTPLTQITMGSYETVLGELRFFNPAVPGTLTQGSGASGTYDRNYHFKSVYSKVSLVNNYQIPVRVKLYCCMPKEDTNIIPITAFSNGLADVGNPSLTSPYVDLTESPQFNKLWKIVKSYKKVLMPGQVMKSSINSKDVMYNPSIFDSHALDYQRKYKTLNWFVRITGVLAHDTVVTTEQSLAPCGLDFITQTIYTVEYDAGVDLKFIVIADTSDAAFTNGGVVSSKPVADNIGYSQA